MGEYLSFFSHSIWKVRSTLKKKLNNYLADRQILNGGNRFFHYNTTQVEMDRVTVNDHQAVNEQPPVLTVSPPGEKHPKGLLRTQSPTPPAYDVVVVGGGQTSSSCATTQVWSDLWQHVHLLVHLCIPHSQ